MSEKNLRVNITGLDEYEKLIAEHRKILDNLERSVNSLVTLRTELNIAINDKSASGN